VAQLEKSFDAIAELYDRARPGYPDSVFERILEFSAVGTSASLLEVGSGTGRATRPFARRGFRILALEPGHNLSKVARARLANFQNVEVQTTSFENWDAGSRSFDLAFIAQAFHWLAPDHRLSKLARVLRRPGTLAVFGNSASIADRPLNDAIQSVYARVAPALTQSDSAAFWYASSDSPILLQLRSSSCFGEANCEFFSWEQALSTSEYCDLLSTYSDHSTLPPRQFNELLAGIGAVVDGHSGIVLLKYKTGLYLARAA
jgi:ubiquinone/menaquinone biosynthesis C-methylase UbiE